MQKIESKSNDLDYPDCPSEVFSLVEILNQTKNNLKGSANKKKRNKINQKIEKLNSVLFQFATVGTISKINYVPKSEPGCYVADCESDWILGCEIFCPCELGLTHEDDIPDISIDPNSGILSIINPESFLKSVFVTFFHKGYHKNGHLLPMGKNLDAQGTCKDCITVVAVVPAGHVMEICYIEIPSNTANLEVFSDVKALLESPSDEPLTNARIFPFPLGGDGPYLCSQGFGGSFTHNFHATFHAIDLECEIGTPILAVGDGVVVDAEDHNSESGISVQNLFLWNSMTILLDSGVYVEYVHIKKSSIECAVGERVSQGQIICESGSVGFCPKPHLHMQVHLSNEPNAPTVFFGLKDSEGKLYFPVAGRWYNHTGECAEPTSPSSTNPRERPI
mmetsp:Transcript_31053/g.41039  ORF Transcript_31053/g.41039 Transcript_31053/m.41039 type:complete len:392 (+) Transcript_31053:207-1382(+)|eukprot:CAMPEP_0117736966 /NCGR_PEP_ID=MMETSP0947-20121206/2249_1 /TAXON_ID=44440 /ORGANISM="Chattonella subsalsa, Strain CCMP2191" /LENGTH=391 /DNA_ID=CAMNT_0005552367 /DNA_START=84 /DNA_END=1259 /DNA_ORIENTATION=-